MRKLLLISLLVLLCGCDTGLRQMGVTEYGVIYRNLPTFLGGGVASKVHEPGALTLIYPWEEMYRIDTSVREISWGFNPDKPNYVASRALDGNEVALAVSLRYQVIPDKITLLKLVELVGVSSDQIEVLVTKSANAFIRQYMNELHTTDFLNAQNRYKAVDKVKSKLNDTLHPFGLEVVSVNLDDFRFERTLEDGKIDASYQEKLNETQRIREETEREKARVDTIIAQKQQEYNDVQAKVNRQVAEADGYKKQAESRGDSYLTARNNEAESILAVGKAEAEGLQQKVQALSGPGGKALLKLDIAKSLMSSNPKFYVMGASNGQSPVLDVRKTDTNLLLEQAGIFEGLKSTDTINNVKGERSSSNPDDKK